MGVLSAQQIRAMTAGEPPLIAGFADLDAQLQPNGFDMTLESIAALAGAGRIGVSNSERVIADARDLAFDGAGYVELPPGVYVARLNETVALPANVMALAKPRSSLLRNGVAVHNAVWDAGYAGRSQVQVVVYNTHGFALAKNARIVQMVFMTLDSPTERLYDGVYQGETAALTEAR